MQNQESEEGKESPPQLSRSEKPEDTWNNPRYRSGSNSVNSPIR